MAALSPRARCFLQFSGSMMNIPPTLLIHVQALRRFRFNLSGIRPMIPLGIASLGAVLEEKGRAVGLFDLTLAEHSGFDPRRDVAPGTPFVGLSATILSVREARDLSAALKQSRPEIPVVLGGPATVFDLDVLDRRFPHVDVFVFEEGEATIVRLAESDFSTEDLAAIPGIAFRDGAILRRTDPAPYMDLDTLPHPARRLLPWRRYGIHPPFGLYPPITLVETARGCPYNCAFCSLPRKLRQRSVDHVLGEIRSVVEDEGVREIHFVDPTFTADEERVIALCEALASEPDPLHWTFKTRADLVSPRLLRACRAAGCYMISYGIESLQDEALASLEKGYSGRDALAALRATRAAGIRTLVYMLLGNPGDTDRTVRRSAVTLRRLGCDYALFSGLFPDPQAEMVRDAYKAGRFLVADVEEFYFGEARAWDRTHGGGISPRKIRTWVILSYLRFYLHPGYIARRIASLKGWGEIRLLLDGFWSLIREFFDSGTVR